MTKPTSKNTAKWLIMIIDNNHYFVYFHSSSIYLSISIYVCVFLWFCIVPHCAILRWTNFSHFYRVDFIQICWTQSHGAFSYNLRFNKPAHTLFCVFGHLFTHNVNKFEDNKKKQQPKTRAMKNKREKNTITTQRIYYK